MNNIKETDAKKQKYDEYVINPRLLYNQQFKYLYKCDEVEVVINSVNITRATYKCVNYGDYKKNNYN